MSVDLVIRLRSSLPGIAQNECGGENLAILLASFFEPGIESDELDDSGTWKQGAIDACNRVLDAIHAHYELPLTEARAEIERLREAAKGQNAVVNTVWNTFVDAPEPGRKFVALYNDGSGARMFYAFDGGVIDCDGDELYGFDLAEQSYGLWAYLPDNLEFWCETRAEDTMTLKVIR